MTGARTVPGGSRVASGAPARRAFDQLPGAARRRRRSAARRRRRAGTPRSPGPAGSGPSTRACHSCGLIIRGTRSTENRCFSPPTPNVMLGSVDPVRSGLLAVVQIGRSPRRAEVLDQVVVDRPRSMARVRRPRRRLGTGSGAARAPPARVRRAARGSRATTSSTTSVSRPRSAYAARCRSAELPRASVVLASSRTSSQSPSSSSCGRSRLTRDLTACAAGTGLGCRVSSSSSPDSPPRAARQIAARCTGGGTGSNGRPRSMSLLGGAARWPGTGRRSARRRRRSGRRRRCAAPGSGRAPTGGRRSRPSWRRRSPRC